jgi:hypothetical protein
MEFRLTKLPKTKRFSCVGPGAISDEDSMEGSKLPETGGAVRGRAGVVETVNKPKSIHISRYSSQWTLATPLLHKKIA